MKNFKVIVLLTLAVSFLAQTLQADDGWSAWKSVNRQALSVFNNGFEWAGGSKPRPSKYRVNGNLYQFQVRMRDPGTGPRGEITYSNQTVDIYARRSESNTTSRPVAPVSPTGDGWSAWKSMDSKAKSIWRKVMSTYMPGSSARDMATKYRISTADKSHYQFYKPVAPDLSPDQANPIVDVYVKPNGKVEMP